MDRWLGDGGMEVIGLVGASFTSYGVDGEDLGWVEGPWTPTALACNPHGTAQAGIHSLILDACDELRHQRRPARARPDPGHARDEDRDHAAGQAGRAASRCAATWCAWPGRSPTARPPRATPGPAREPVHRHLPALSRRGVVATDPGSRCCADAAGADLAAALLVRASCGRRRERIVGALVIAAAWRCRPRCMRSRRHRNGASSTTATTPTSPNGLAPSALVDTFVGTGVGGNERGEHRHVPRRRHALRDAAVEPRHHPGPDLGRGLLLPRTRPSAASASPT